MSKNSNHTNQIIRKKTLKFKIYILIKRICDILISLIGIIFLIPIAIIIKIAYIFMGDFHSIIFTQKRIGQNGKEFKFYKFRSMVVNADEILFESLKKSPKLAAEYKKYKKLKDDPRMTKVGRIIRNLSIDELPQVINVLIGNMSLIGNRPYLPREKEDIGKYFDIIVSTKPGITGYWQVNGRSNTTFKERLKLEKYYSENCSLIMDIKIFLKTFKVVLFGKGAK